MDSQLFPNLFHYIQSTWPVVDRWLRHHNVFTVTLKIGVTLFNKNGHDTKQLRSRT